MKWRRFVSARRPMRALGLPLPLLARADEVIE
jgi:hypothetical protein